MPTWIHPNNANLDLPKECQHELSPLEKKRLNLIFLNFPQYCTSNASIILIKLQLGQSHELLLSVKYIQGGSHRGSSYNTFRSSIQCTKLYVLSPLGQPVSKTLAEYLEGFCFLPFLYHFKQTTYFFEPLVFPPSPYSSQTSFALIYLYHKTNLQSYTHPAVYNRQKLSNRKSPHSYAHLGGQSISLQGGGIAYNRHQKSSYFTIYGQSFRGVFHLSSLLPMYVTEVQRFQIKNISYFIIFLIQNL